MKTPPVLLALTLFLAGCVKQPQPEPEPTVGDWIRGQYLDAQLTSIEYGLSGTDSTVNLTFRFVYKNATDKPLEITLHTKDMTYTVPRGQTEWDVQAPTVGVRHYMNGGMIQLGVGITLSQEITDEHGNGHRRMAAVPEDYAWRIA